MDGGNLAPAVTPYTAVVTVFGGSKVVQDFEGYQVPIL